MPLTEIKSVGCLRIHLHLRLSVHVSKSGQSKITHCYQTYTSLVLTNVENSNVKSKNVKASIYLYIYTMLLYVFAETVLLNIWYCLLIPIYVMSEAAL